MQNGDDIHHIASHSVYNDVGKTRNGEQPRPSHGAGSSGQRQDIQTPDRMLDSLDNPSCRDWIELGDVIVNSLDIAKRPLFVADHLVRREYRSLTS